MVKRTIEAQGVFLGAALDGVAEAVAVGTLGISVGFGWFFNVEALGE